MPRRSAKPVTEKPVIIDRILGEPLISNDIWGFEPDEEQDWGVEEPAAEDDLIEVPDPAEAADPIVEEKKKKSRRGPRRKKPAAQVPEAMLKGVPPQIRRLLNELETPQYEDAARARLAAKDDGGVVYAIREKDGEVMYFTSFELQLLIQAGISINVEEIVGIPDTVPDLASVVESHFAETSDAQRAR